MIKIAMVRMDAAMRKRNLQARMLLQVHDELLFESPPDEVETVSTLAARDHGSCAAARRPDRPSI